MQKFNYHTHTRRCGHADNNMSDEDFVKLFIQKGFTKNSIYRPLSWKRRNRS